MIDFGFKINPSGTIDLEKADRHLYFKLARIEPDIKICIGCGSCSATCSAAPFGGVSFRRIILALERGEDTAALLENCMLCGKCTMVCPRGINTRHAILSLCRIYDNSR